MKIKELYVENIGEKEIEENKTLLKNKNFIKMWFATAISTFALNFYRLLLPLTIYDLTDSVLEMSIMRAIEIIPILVPGLFIGVLLDRYNRKKFMNIAIVLQILSITILLSIVFSSTLEIWNLYVLGFLYYTGYYIFCDAHYSLVPSIVEQNQLLQTNSVRVLTNRFINMVGPAVAGILLLFSYKANLIIIMLLYVILLFLLLKMKIPNSNEIKKETKKSVITEFHQGWKYLFNTKSIYKFTVVILFVNISTASSNAVLIFYALDVLNLKSSIIGIIFSGTAIGGILAAIRSSKIKNKFKQNNVIYVSIIIILISQLLLYLSENWLHLFLAMFLIGFSTTLLNIYYATIIQEQTPSNLLGRVSSLTDTVVLIATPISFITAGILGESYNVNLVFLISAFMLFLLLLKLLLPNNKNA